MSPAEIWSRVLSVSEKNRDLISPIMRASCERKGQRG